jgi:hypothetical protein
MAPKATAPGPGLRPALHLAAVIVLGQAIVSGGHGFSPAALACVGIALAIITAALFVPATGRGAGLAHAVLVAGVAIDFYRLPWIAAYVQVPAARALLQPFVGLAALSAVLAAALLLRRPRAVLPACFPLLLVAQFLMGAFHLGLSPDPRVDVYVVQHLGCQALLRGNDPYAITFPNPYGTDVSYFPPGAVLNGQVQCGYPYPPVPLLMALPGQLLAGDVRYAELAALVAAAAVIAYGFPRAPGRARASIGPAMLLLFAPGVFHLLENAWIEPYLILLLAATAALAARRWLWPSAVSAGLLLAAKQYAPLLSPAVLLIAPAARAARFRWGAVAVAAGAVVTLPFIAWGPHAFVHSLTVLNVGMIRSDAISFLPTLLRATGWHPPLLPCPAVAAVVAAGLVLWRAPRTPAGFAGGFGLIATCLFAASPLAFGNYYALAGAALCVAAVAEG